MGKNIPEKMGNIKPELTASLINSNLTAPQNNYMVVGVADDFIVPKTGEYTFEIRCDDALLSPTATHGPTYREKRTHGEVAVTMVW